MSTYLENESLLDDEPPTDALAITAIVLAFGGLAIPVIPSIAALIVAPFASRRITQSNGTIQGEGLIRGAQIIAWLGLAGMAVLAATIYFFM